MINIMVPNKTKDKNNRHHLQSETYFNLKGYIFMVESRYLSYMNIWLSLLFTSITHHKKKINIQPFKILILVIFFIHMGMHWFRILTLTNTKSIYKVNWFNIQIKKRVYCSLVNKLRGMKQNYNTDVKVRHNSSF